MSYGFSFMRAVLWRVIVNLYPSDEQVEKYRSGDIIYRFVETMAFLVADEVVIVEDGKEAREVRRLDGEPVYALAVALIQQQSFCVFWTIRSSTEMNDVPISGVPMVSETTARRLFPNLGEYSFESR